MRAASNCASSSDDVRVNLSGLTGRVTGVDWPQATAVVLRSKTSGRLMSTVQTNSFMYLIHEHSHLPRLDPSRRPNSWKRKDVAPKMEWPCHSPNRPGHEYAMADFSRAVSRPIDCKKGFAGLGRLDREEGCIIKKGRVLK